ncbi:HD domain-containing protein [Anaerospora sp.]|uniref:HD domain-containing protein n=1 Tax=Anaerospora sp. TaxID=1960278 RepID=UPI00289D6D4C|nr:HD domain-containing protein [Anaerospora sp.]
MMISKALYIAKVAHKGQVDKGGNPYVMHPIAVSQLVHSEEEKIVALLHDVVEDTDITLEHLKLEGFSDNIIAAVSALTKQPGVAYDDYIATLKENSIAVRVKIADITHNSDISRIPNPTEKDLERIKRYEMTLAKLKNDYN